MVDAENKIVTTPAYMFNGKFHEIQDGRFFGNSEWFVNLDMTGLGDQDFFLWSVLSSSWVLFNGSDNIHSIQNFSENNMSSVQPWCLDSGQKELGSICVFTGICH